MVKIMDGTKELTPDEKRIADEKAAKRRRRNVALTALIVIIAIVIYLKIEYFP